MTDRLSVTRGRLATYICAWGHGCRVSYRTEGCVPLHGKSLRAGVCACVCVCTPPPPPLPGRRGPIRRRWMSEWDCAVPVYNAADELVSVAGMNEWMDVEVDVEVWGRNAGRLFVCFTFLQPRCERTSPFVKIDGGFFLPPPPHRSRRGTGSKHNSVLPTTLQSAYILNTEYGVCTEYFGRYSIGSECGNVLF